MKFYNRNGILYIRINGKRLSTKLKDTKANRKKVSEYYKDNEFFKKFNVSKEVPSLLELCEEVLEEKEKTLKPSSLSAYTSIYNAHIVPNFNKKVNLIKAYHIDEWYKKFTDRSTIVTCEAILRPAFEKAIIREYIDSSPLIVKKPRLKSDYKINPFNLNEINKLLTHKDDWFTNFLGVAFFTGARIGEILALEWNDIDFDNYTININKTQSRYLMTPKSSSGIRVIDMLPQTEKFLKKQRHITGLSKLVFYTDKNKILKASSYLYARWKNLLKQTNLEYRNIYQARHSFASNMLSNKEDLHWVSQMLGHKNPSLTQQRYFKYIPKRAGRRKNTFLDELDTKTTQQIV